MDLGVAGEQRLALRERRCGGGGEGDACQHGKETIFHGASLAGVAERVERRHIAAMPARDTAFMHT